MNSKISNYNHKYYTITLNNKIYKIHKKYKKYSLLKILQFNHIHILYQCQTGYCGTCRIKLIKGKIKYFNNNFIAFLNPGEILSCYCTINSNIIIAML
ncbi:class I ribonucleotide reductase maintenance protein YfaE [Buchnera aphidicola]|uniref:2Fe-2S ferredoxin-type domain-containing protein n=1 Tax=Buchnera aphidicola (Stegophylla sp.) TaxID=2315800 RepID=A0A4D6YKE8_9GAMM|nr:2Fe-2S iron-sulfur cluster binding domain-containing protein [Buchnera aphidicola (Stegophylla sp.)]QCI26310.1 hypothetical protein D9V79_00605 [Buchnera aphidicola (Stegophylla sp.)]